MSRLKNLYTHLITNRRPEVDGWLQRYIAFTNDVEKIREALNRGLFVQDKMAYIEPVRNPIVFESHGKPRRHVGGL